MAKKSKENQQKYSTKSELIKKLSKQEPVTKKKGRPSKKSPVLVDLKPIKVPKTLDELNLIQTDGKDWSEPNKSLGEKERENKTLEELEVQKLVAQQQLKVFNKHNAKSLSELLGNSSANEKSDNQYVGPNGKFLTEMEYLDFLTKMNKYDLEVHAASLGVPNKDDKNLLINNLIREFRKTTNPFHNGSQVLESQRKTPSAALIKILAEGK